MLTATAPSDDRQNANLYVYTQAPPRANLRACRVLSGFRVLSCPRSRPYALWRCEVRSGVSVCLVMRGVVVRNGRTRHC
jgi:hypothetical protein